MVQMSFGVTAVLLGGMGPPLHLGSGIHRVSPGPVDFVLGVRLLALVLLLLFSKISLLSLTDRNTQVFVYPGNGFSLAIFVFLCTLRHSTSQSPCCCCDILEDGKRGFCSGPHSVGCLSCPLACLHPQRLAPFQITVSFWPHLKC